MQFDFTVNAATCFWSAFTFLIRPATRGSFADDVPCAIGTATATSARPKRSHGIKARLIFSSLVDPPIRLGVYVLSGLVSRTEHAERLLFRARRRPAAGERLHARRVDDVDPGVRRVPGLSDVEGRDAVEIRSAAGRVDVPLAARTHG